LVEQVAGDFFVEVGFDEIGVKVEERGGDFSLWFFGGLGAELLDEGGEFLEA
jgi:hypothetical protein